MLFIQLLIVFLPLGLLAGIALQRPHNLAAFIVNSASLASGIAFVWMAMPWDVVTVYYRMVVPVLLVGALVLGYRRIGTAAEEPSTATKVLSYGINIVMTAAFTLMNLGVIAGYSRPAGTIELSSPLGEGRYVIGQGGASPFLNGHFRVPPQNYALDVIGLNGWGMRRVPFSDPSVLANYAIWGAEIIAPCNGSVLLAVDSLPDLNPPRTDRENLAGNHVLLECDGNEIVLAHMQQGSVRVAPGQNVQAGDRLGNVGNSGNTSEPHLHIHIETLTGEETVLDGDAVPFTVDGRWLARNGRF